MFSTLLKWCRLVKNYKKELLMLEKFRRVLREAELEFCEFPDANSALMHVHDAVFGNGSDIAAVKDTLISRRERALARIVKLSSR